MTLKNKIIKKTGHFICNGKCGDDAGAKPRLIKGYTYCQKCYDIEKGIRNENGTLKRYDLRTRKQLDNHNAMKEASSIRG